MKKFDEDYHLNANAQYIYLRKMHKEDTDVDYGAIWLHADVKGDEYERNNLTPAEQRIAQLMTEHEEYMHKNGLQWNENGYTDYETAMESLITCQELIDNGYAQEHCVEDDHINWCENCGKPFLSGYMVGNGHTACSDDCMRIIIAGQFDADVSEGDNLFWLQTLENNPWYFNSEYV